MLRAESDLQGLIRDARLKRPPAEDYHLLEPLAKLRLGQTVGFVDLIGHARNNDDIFRLCKALETRRKPMNDLARAVVKAASDLTGARKSRKRLADQKADGGPAKKARVAVIPEHVISAKPIFGMDGLQPLPSLSSASVLCDYNLDKPFVMNMAVATKKLQAGPCPLSFVVVVVAKEVTVIVVDLVLLV